MFKRRPTARIVTDAAGLGKLVQDLHWGNEGLSAAARGVDVRVYAQSRGTFLVTLDANQTEILRRRVRSYEFSDVYGPRTDGG